MLTRTIDYLKGRGITAFFTTLSKGDDQHEETEVSISSLIDTWLHLRTFESGGERARGLVVIKSRGMAHSNQVREFLLTDTGVKLRDPYVGPGQVLMGSSREVQEARDRERAGKARQSFERHQREMEGERQKLEAQIEAMRLLLNNLALEMNAASGREHQRTTRQSRQRNQLKIARKADLDDGKNRDEAHRRKGREAARILEGAPMGPATLHRGPHPEGRKGTGEPGADLPRAPRRGVPHRGHRSSEDTAAGPGGPDRRGPHPRTEHPHPDAQDHRRPFQHRAGAHRPRHPAPMKSKKAGTPGRGKVPAARASRAGGRSNRPWQFDLVLYVAGMDRKSSEAIKAITRLCDKHLEGRYQLGIVDIYQQPEQAPR